MPSACLNSLVWFVDIRSSFPIFLALLCLRLRSVHELKRPCRPQTLPITSSSSKGIGLHSCLWVRQPPWGARDVPLAFAAISRWGEQQPMTSQQFCFTKSNYLRFFFCFYFQMATMSCKNWEMMSCKQHLTLILESFFEGCSLFSHQLIVGLVMAGWGSVVGEFDGANMFLPDPSRFGRLTLKTSSKQFETLRWSLMYYCISRRCLAVVLDDLYIPVCCSHVPAKNQGVPLMINFMWCCRWAPQMVEGEFLFGSLWWVPVRGHMFWENLLL